MRIAAFALVDWAWSVLRDWADAAGHEIALLVTLPPVRGDAGLGDLSAAGVDAPVLLVPDVLDCRAMLADRDVDLGVVFTFRRMPEAVASIPRLGTVNLHSSLLPADRGANGYRALYDGAPRLGATLHHLTPVFDAGAILARASEPTPREPEPSDALDALKRCATAALHEGMPRALAGEAGEPQDDAAATDAPRFRDEERVLALDVDVHTLACRFSALALSGIQPSIRLGEENHPLQAVRRLPGLASPGPGVVSLSGRRAIAATRDGVVELALGRLPF